MNWDKFWMTLAKVLAAVLILVLLYAAGAFDAIIGRDMMYRDYYEQHK